MAKQVKLKARPRVAIGSSTGKQMRRQGRIPANMYGAHDPATSLEVSAVELSNVLSHALGEQILVELEIESESGPVNRLALIQEVQHQPVSGAILHVDFHAIASDEEIHAEVPVEPTGEATGVKDFGGLLEQSVRHLNISCLPKDLPEVIVVDVTALNVGEAIHVSDVVLRRA